MRPAAISRYVVGRLHVEAFRNRRTECDTPIGRPPTNHGRYSIMITRPLLRALAAATILFLCVPAWGAEKVPPSSSSASQSDAGSVAKARALVKRGKFNEALILLRPWVGRRAIEDDVLFLIGLAAIGASQKPGVSENARDTFLDAAIVAYHSMLVRRPELVRVRLELARAFFLKGEDRLARRHFEQVLAGKPPAAVALNVNRFLNIMRARKRWSLRVGASLLPDTNIGAGSDERIIYIPIGGRLLPFVRDQEGLTSSGVGISAWLGGGVPVSPERPLAAARRRRHLAEGVSDERVRPDDGLRPCRAALADRPRQRGEPAPERAPSLDGLGV